MLSPGVVNQSWVNQMRMGVLGAAQSLMPRNLLQISQLLVIVLGLRPPFLTSPHTALSLCPSLSSCLPLYLLFPSIRPVCWNANICVCAVCLVLEEDTQWAFSERLLQTNKCTHIHWLYIYTEHVPWHCNIYNDVEHEYIYEYIYIYNDVDIYIYIFIYE